MAITECIVYLNGFDSRRSIGNVLFFAFFHLYNGCNCPLITHTHTSHTHSLTFLKSQVVIKKLSNNTT